MFNNKESIFVTVVFSFCKRIETFFFYGFLKQIFLHVDYNIQNCPIPTEKKDRLPSNNSL